ncbi:MAG TPA: alpha/beta hydrolase [Pseudonocardiaceae bacterium]|nr:alpha/beta hydrolase [Pseudonocardiaceae bacterium]
MRAGAGRTAAVDGRAGLSTSTLRISSHGAGAPAVVLEPGMGASGIGWSRVRDRLAGRTRVITYDRAGLGDSPPAPGDRGIAALATDLATVLAEAEAAPAVVVGHSLGATIARQLAATRPELVAGLVLIDPIPEQWVLKHAWWAEPIGRLMYRSLATLARHGLMDAITALPGASTLTRSSTSPLAGFTAAERAVLAEEMRRPHHHLAAGREYTGLLRSRADLLALRRASTSVPCTVLSGGQAAWWSGSLRRTATTWHARLARGGRHVVVPGGGHFLPRYQPEVVVGAVEEVIAGLVGAPVGFGG